MLYAFAFFPGQGSQTPGMGKSLYENSAAAKAVFDRVSAATNISMSQLCFDSEMDVLSRTENAQLAIFTHSMAAWEVLREAGHTFSACAGFSLGEYTALVAAGVLSLEDGATLICKRGQLMQQAADAADSGMAAILGLEDAVVEQVCAQCANGVLPVNYNCPGQLVIAGPKAALLETCEQCKTAGARRAVPLAVSGAFHTPLMKDAASALGTFAQSLTYHAPNMPIYTNVTGQILDMQDLPAHLERHMISPVQWRTLVENGISAGLTTACEIGSGKTLAGFARKISKDIEVCCIETMENVISLN